MTRTSIVAVSAFAVLGTSCLFSNDASAFGHGFGGHFPFAAQPLGGHPMAPFSARRPSFAANHFSSNKIHQLHLETAHVHTHVISHKAKASATRTDLAKAASGCGLRCRQPGGPALGGAGKGPGGTGAGTGGTGTGDTTATGTGGTATATGGTSTVNITGGHGSGGGAADAISQFAAAISGLGQAQAAPVQQVAAAPAQQVVARAPTQRIVAETADLKAIALGWNNSGAWVVRTSPTLAGAGADAVQNCNAEFGECTLSEAHVAPTSFGCLVVVQSDDASRVFAAAASSIDTAREAAAGLITDAGLHGQIVYTGCNS